VPQFPWYMTPPVLQVALDLLELDRALVIADEAVAGGADWWRQGPRSSRVPGWMRCAGSGAVPGREIVADMKVADTGTLEVEMAAKAGATIVCILADADDAVVQEAVRAGTSTASG